MKTTWTQRDGTKIKIRDMSESHIRNAAALVIRNARARVEHELIAAYHCEAWLQGEMALDCVARDISRMEDMDDLEAVEFVFGEDSEAYAVAWKASFLPERTATCGVARQKRRILALAAKR